MDTKSQITNLYEIIFEEIPDPGTLESLILHYKQNNNSVDAVENYLRNDKKFKKLSVELETELKVAELYYNILERMPDEEGMNFYKNQLYAYMRIFQYSKKGELLISLYLQPHYQSNYQ